MSKPTIVLTMIVKNEEKVIERCLFSCLKLIDYYVICDTGSTDNTIQVIENFSKKYGLKGEVHQHQWVNFELNRNLSLEIAKKKGDYIFWIDADDILEYDQGWTKPELTKDAYLMDIFYHPVNYKRIHILKSSIPSKWEGILHECLSVDQKTTVIDMLFGVRMLIIGGGGGRNTDPKKHEKDAVILENALQKEPENTRYMFYLAQSYRNFKDFDNAIKWYEKRSQYDEHPEERMYAKYQVGALKSTLKTYPMSECIHDLLVSHSYFPSRIEPVFVAVCFYNKLELYKPAYSLGIQFVHLKKADINCLLFTEEEVFKWKIQFETGYAAFQLGNYIDALLLYLYIFFYGNPPEQILEQVKNNISACCNRLNLGQINISKANVIEFLDKTQENNIRKLFYSI